MRRTATILAFLAAPALFAGESSAKFEFAGGPPWIADSTPFEGAVRVEGLGSITKLSILYLFPGGKSGAVDGVVDKADPALYRFRLPASPGSGPGKLSIHAEAFYGPGGKKRAASVSQSVPLSWLKELDITGDAAIALLYPLGGPEYTVRYIPCCNIFGGVTVAERIPVNPAESAADLPEKLLSDFVVLKPDGLSASTMGLYFDFLLGADRFKGVTPALYEFNGRAWTEFHGYETDLATGRISVHCPQGGTFVVGARR